MTTSAKSAESSSPATTSDSGQSAALSTSDGDSSFTPLPYSRRSRLSSQPTPAGLLVVFGGASWISYLVTTKMEAVPPLHKFYGLMILWGALLLPLSVVEIVAGGVASGLRKRIGGKG